MTILGVDYVFIAEPPVLTDWPAEPAVCHALDQATNTTNSRSARQALYDLYTAVGAFTL